MNWPEVVVGVLIGVVCGAANYVLGRWHGAEAERRRWVSVLDDRERARRAMDRTNEQRRWN